MYWYCVISFFLCLLCCVFVYTHAQFLHRPTSPPIHYNLTGVKYFIVDTTRSTSARSNATWANEEDCDSDLEEEEEDDDDDDDDEVAVVVDDDDVLDEEDEDEDWSLISTLFSFFLCEETARISKSRRNNKIKKKKEIKWVILHQMMRTLKWKFLSVDS